MPAVVPLLESLLDWIRSHPRMVGWLGAISVVTFIGTLAAVPWLVARIPADYFVRPRSEKSPWRFEHPVAATAIRILKNVCGVLFILAGIAMLILPGQGILTILLGIMLVDFPGKRRFELALIRRPRVLRTVNWMRRRSGREALQTDRSPGT